MKTKQTTKRALLSSLIAMLLCLALLMGSTLAWFTDSASTGVNKIQSGNLDVVLETPVFNDYNEVMSWTEVKQTTKLFDDKALWEPGYTQVVYLRVRNNGSLALKYKFAINEADKHIGKTAGGQDIDLADYISFGVVKTETKYETRTEARNLVNGNSQPIATGYTSEESLGVGDNSGLLALVVYMPENVGNEANHGPDEGDAPWINLGVELVATQDTVEYDSFDNLYDDGLSLVVGNKDIAEKLANVQPGETVLVPSGDYNLPEIIAAGANISGSGADSTVLHVPAVPRGVSGANTGLVIDQPGVTISSAEIQQSATLGDSEYCGFIDIREGGTTLDGIKIVETNDTNASAILIQRGVDVGETVRIVNSILEGRFKTIDIVDGANGTVEIDNCEISGIYTFNVNSASSQNLEIHVTNTKLHGWTSYGDIKSASFTNTEFTMGSGIYNYLRPYADTTLTNCTFGGDFQLGAGKTAAGKTLTFVNCTFDGAKLTAENFQSMIDRGDLENLQACIITVDGVTVTLS